MRTPLSLFTTIRTARWRVGIIVLSTCCGLAGAYAVTSLLPATYQARSSVAVMYTNDVRATSSRFDLSMLQAMVPTVAHLAESTNTVMAAARSARVPYDQVVGRAEAAYEPGDTIITLTVSATTPTAASAVSNALADVIHERVSAGRVVLGRRGVLAAEPLDHASPPDEPATPKRALNLALGGLLGLFAGVAVVALGARSDTRLRTSGQIEAALGLGVLGTVPRTRQLRGGARKAFGRRRVAASVRSAVAALAPYTALPGRRLLVTSPTESEPKTLVAALLGLGFAEQEMRVTLIDAELGRPRLAKHFPERTGESLQRLLATDREPSSSRREALRVVLADASPPSTGRRLLSSPSFRTLVGQETSRCDVVLLNGPPVLAGTDLSALVDHADSAVLVVTSGSTEQSEARKAAQILGQFGLPIAGVVVANTSDAGDTGDTGMRPLTLIEPANGASTTSTTSTTSTASTASTVGAATERTRHAAGSSTRW